MTTYYAAAKYPIDATDKEKVQALRAGLVDVAIDLIGLGQTLHQVEDALDDARNAAEEEELYVRNG